MILNLGLEKVNDPNFKGVAQIVGYYINAEPIYYPIFCKPYNAEIAHYWMTRYQHQGHFITIYSLGKKAIVSIHHATKLDFPHDRCSDLKLVHDIFKHLEKSAKAFKWSVKQAKGWK